MSYAKKPQPHNRRHNDIQRTNERCKGKLKKWIRMKENERGMEANKRNDSKLLRIIRSLIPSHDITICNWMNANLDIICRTKYSASEIWNLQPTTVERERARERRRRRSKSLILSWQLCDHIQEITILHTHKKKPSPFKQKTSTLYLSYCLTCWWMWCH